MLTSARLARAIDDAILKAPPAPVIAPITARQKQLAKLHVRGSLVRVRCELSAVSAEFVEWKVKGLEHAAGYRIGSDTVCAHCTITLIDEQTMLIETLGRSAKATAAPLNPTGWGMVAAAVEAWVRELAGLGLLPAARLPR